MGATRMNRLRAFFCDHRRFAVVLIALTLAMKALVPAGYMVDREGAVFTVHICADQTGQTITRQVTIPKAGQGDQHKAQADTPCQFIALGHAALGGADPILLALALGFVLALGFADWRALQPRGGAWLRPPLRGPPAVC